MIRKIIAGMLLSCGITGFAQEEFKCYIENKEYSVFMQLNLYEETVKIPGQEIFGETYGYLKKTTDPRVWMITGVKINEKERKATLEIVNDYGSEDLTAELLILDDGSYQLRQLEGSTIKVAGKSKWIKLPKILLFNKQQK